MATQATAPADGALGGLFESSPASVTRTSAAATTAFVAGLAAALSVPFSLMGGVSLSLSAVALVTSIIGLARSSRPAVAGSVLASVGLVLALAAASLVAMRFVGIDTAVGDPVLPTLVDWLGKLNTLVHAP